VALDTGQTKSALTPVQALSPPSIYLPCTLARTFPSAAHFVTHFGVVRTVPGDPSLLRTAPTSRGPARAYTTRTARRIDARWPLYSLDHPFLTLSRLSLRPTPRSTLGLPPLTARSAPPAVGGGRRARRLGARRDGCAPGVAALPVLMPMRCGGQRARGASALRHVIITPARRPVRGGGRGARCARTAAHLALPRGRTCAEALADRPLVAQRHAVARAVLARAVLARAAAGVAAGAWAEVASAAGGVAADTAGARCAPPRATVQSRPWLCRPCAARARADRKPALIRVMARWLGGRV